MVNYDIERHSKNSLLTFCAKSDLHILPVSFSKGKILGRNSADACFLNWNYILNN
jgi:hypothetical protein